MIQLEHVVGANYAYNLNKNTGVYAGILPDGSNIYRPQGNKINTGDGNDYVTYAGKKHIIDMGNGENDKCLAVNSSSKTNSTIKNAKSSTYKENSQSATIANFDNLDGWVRHGEDGNCGVLSFINSLSHCTGQTDFSDIITVEPYTYVDESDGKSKQAYNVTFNKYNENYASKDENLVGTISVTQDELNNFIGAYGDADTRLFLVALEKLILENNPDFANEEDAKAKGKGLLSYVYNSQKKLFSKYVFGIKEGYQYSYSSLNETNVTNIINHFMAGDLSNLTILFNRTTSDYSVGLVYQHFYAIKTFDEEAGYIELVNPLDDNDSVKFTFEYFLDYYSSINIYGYTKSEISAFFNTPV